MIPASSTFAIGGTRVRQPNLRCPPRIAQFRSEYLWFEVVVGAAGTFVNQATVESDQTPPVFSDGNGDRMDGTQPTEFSAVEVPGAGVPDLDVEKRWVLSSDVNGDGLVNPGDTLIYTVYVSNVGSAYGTDVRFSDEIPIDTTLVSGSVSTSQGVVVTEDPVLVNIGIMDPGGVVTISFQVMVDLGTPDGTIISNQGTVRSEELPDEPSDDNGTDGDGKNPNLTPVGGGVSGEPSGLIKSLQGSSEGESVDPAVLVGEVLTYRVQVDVPAGTTYYGTVYDTLPSGMSYLAGSGRLARVFTTGLQSSADPGGVNGVPSGTFVPLTDGSEVVVSGQEVSVFLHDIINSDNDGDAESFIFELKAVVENVVENQAGTDLTDQGGFRYWNGLSQEQSLTPAEHVVTVLEPGFEVVKVGEPLAVFPSGGTVTFTVTVRNPSGPYTAAGYDVLIRDALPLAYGNLQVVSIAPSGIVAGAVHDQSSGTVLEVLVDEFPVDGELVITYTADAGPQPSGTL